VKAVKHLSAVDRVQTDVPDPHRPGFHFLPAKNWMNDPNGLIHWKGQYHLFYQYNPNGAFNGTIHWGHAVSADLLHWQDLPIALTPTPGGPDAEGCWSGCAVDNKGVPTLIYTGIHPQVVCLATGSDDLVHWEKHPANPVIAAPPAELGMRSGGQFRDPFVSRVDRSWQMVIGSRIEGQGGLVLRYRSDDLLHWEYMGVLQQGDTTQTNPFWTGTMWECPNFFRLDGQDVLLFSVQSERGDLSYPVYYSGRFHDQRFTPQAQGILVHGNSFYAPQVMRLADGRTVMFGWLKEGRRQTALLEAGWAGVMSLPLTLSTMPGGALRIAPVEELKALRREHWHLENINITPGATGLLGDMQGDGLEIEAVFEPAADAEFGLRLRCSPDGKEQTRLVYQGEQQRLVVEPNDSSLSTVVDRDLHKAPLTLDSRGQLRLHIFLDRSVLEVFANDHTCLASRIYPTRPDSLGLDVFARYGRAGLISIDIWKIDSVWP
jgi:beta-fructofuranosidase